MFSAIKYCNCLEEHQFRAFDKLFELLDPLSTEGAVNDSMVAGKSAAHDIRNSKNKLLEKIIYL